MILGSVAARNEEPATTLCLQLLAYGPGVDGLMLVGIPTYTKFWQWRGYAGGGE